ncbi:serine hydrolase [Phormidesmis priestleyi]
MRDGNDPNAPFEGNASEEKLSQRPISQPPSRRLSHQPRPIQKGGRRSTRPEPPSRGQKASTPQPKRSIDDSRPGSKTDGDPSRVTRRDRRKAGRRQSEKPDRKPDPSTKRNQADLRRQKRSVRDTQFSKPYSTQHAVRPAAKPARPRTRSAAALLYGTRLLILGVGVGVIAGTILSVWDPASRFTAGASSEKTEQATPTPPTPEVPTLQLGEEILPLKTQLQALTAQQPQLTAGVMVVDLDTNTYLNLNAATPLPCASTIKLPVLVAFFEDVDAGKIRLDELLTMRPELIATESGEMQYQPPGSQFTALETATKMITISDNTATNLLIDRLGGKDALNQRFQSWGLTSTAIHNLLPDVEGTNTSSSQDLVSLLGLVSNGKLLSMRSRDRLLDIMRHTVTNTLLPSGLGEGATIAHKTGNIGGMTGDVGLVDMPSGKRYLIGVMVKRPRNDDHGEELIRQASRITYQYFSQPAPNPTSTPSQGAVQPRSKIAQP